MKRINIAIDGPAGAGKSTVARLVAECLGYLYVDTGAMYRALTYKALRDGIDLNDEEKLSEMAKSSQLLLINDGESGQRILLDGEDVTEAIRTPEVSRRVSIVAAVPGVRRRMTELQRRMASPGGVVMDGRDIGSTVLPEAERKIFLTASLEERARRRWQEMVDKGMNMDFKTLQEEMEARDRLDSERETAPLLRASDAVLLDTTGLNLQEVVERVVALCREKFEQ